MLIIVSQFQSFNAITSLVSKPGGGSSVFTMVLLGSMNFKVHDEAKSFNLFGGF